MMMINIPQREYQYLWNHCWKISCVQKVVNIWTSSFSVSVYLSACLHTNIYIPSHKAILYLHFLCYIAIHWFEANSSNSHMKRYQITSQAAGPYVRGHALCLRAHEWNRSLSEFSFHKFFFIFSKSHLTSPDLRFSSTSSFIETREVIPRGRADDDN